MLPIDNQSTNEYINALKAQFGQIRRAENKSVFFTSRADNEDSIEGYFALFEDYKILGEDWSAPDTEAVLTATIGPESALYQIWQGDPLHLVVGDGVLVLSSGFWLIPTGVEVTVTQNGGTVLSAETFFAVGDPAFMYLEDDVGVAAAMLPYRGKAFYGHLTLADNDNTLTLAVIRPDRTFHVQQFSTSAAAQDRQTPVLFTHIFCATGGIEIYFTGKELTFVDADYPADAYVAPTFVYVPD